MAHILGILAVVTALLCFQLKTRKNIIAVNLTSRFLYIFQYILLGAFEGAALDFCAFVFSFVAKNKNNTFIAKHIKLIIIAINIVLIAVGFVLYENIFSIFAILGVM